MKNLLKLNKENAAQLIVVAVLVIFAALSIISSFSPKGAVSMNGASGARGMGMQGGGAPTGSGAPSGSAPKTAGNAAAGSTSTAASGAAGAASADRDSGAPRAAGSTAGAAKSGSGFGTAQTAAANTITVSVKTIEPETIRSTVKINGDVSSKSEVSVYPITSGKITQLRKKLGDSITKGEIIAYVDPSKPGSAYAASPVTAPVSGTIIALNAATGDTVSAATTIATIGSLTDLEVTVYVSEKYANYLQTGLPAFLSLTSSPNEQFSAKVASVSPVVDKTSRTLKLSLELDEYDSRIKPGMFASVSLVIQQEENTFSIPKDALKSYNDDSAVFIVDDANCAKRVIVTTGISNDSDIQITTGLTAGMRVIIAGSVTDGSPVRIVEK